MRPDILNPLFTEISVLKGVGSTLTKPLERLGLGRAVDLAFHLPTSWIDRKRVTELDMVDEGRVLSIYLTTVDYTASGGARADSKTAIEGKRVYVRVDSGGRGLMKKKTEN